MTDRPRRLGRGLEALLGVSASTDAAADRAALQRIPVAKIRPNPYQPRKEFKPDDLADLEASLKSSGLLQPIVVRPSAESGYELIAGERRLRAATRIGWSEIPAVVKEIDDRALLSLALVENLQRTDLNVIEEAEGYERLIQEFSLTQQQVADVIGKDRTTVTNMLRLLQLPPAVRRMVQEGQLSGGHARALLGLDDARELAELAREVAASGLTVREVERRVRERGASPDSVSAPEPKGSAPQFAQSAEARLIQDALRRRLQTDVTLRVTERDRGRIEITFYSNDDLQRLLELILGREWDTR